MSDVTDEELLRLARKAFGEPESIPQGTPPGELRLKGAPDGDWQTLYRVHLDPPRGATELIAVRHRHPSSRAALYAALLVLADELDVRALWSELALRRRELSELGKDYNDLIEITIPALTAELDHLREELAKAGRAKGKR